MKMKSTIYYSLLTVLVLALVNPLSAQTTGLEQLSADQQAKIQQAMAAKVASLAAGSKLTLGLGELAEEGVNSPLFEKMITDGDMVLVTAMPKTAAADLLTGMQAAGGQKCMIMGGTVCGWVPVSQLKELESVGALHCAMPEYRPIHKAGSTTSQGDRAMLADVARATFEVNGDGVTVGILSDAFNTLGGAPSGVATGDLPGPGNPNGFSTPVDVLSELAVGTGIDEGRAMAEIVHDLAPGAEIKFYSASNGYFDFADGIIALEEAGCDIIVDDIAYLAEPYFQDGTIAQAATEVAERGAVFFSAAGNQARESYEADFAPAGFYIPNVGELHDFSGTGDYFQSFVVPPGAQLFLWLQWDDPSVFAAAPEDGGAYFGPAPQGDYDMYLFNGTTGALEDASFFDNPVAGFPIEIVSYFNPTPAPVLLEVAISRFAGPSDRRLKYIDWGSGLNPAEYDTKSGTCVAHSQADGGFGIGASFYVFAPEYGTDPPQVNSYSSAGGVPILVDAQGNRLSEPIIRNQPVVVGSDAGNNTFFGFDADGDGFPNFFGTSAAAPHVAAVAALMLELDPDLENDEIGKILSMTAIDMDDPSTPDFDEGFDFGTGHGFVQADAALAATLDQPVVYRFVLIDPVTDLPIRTLRENETIELTADENGVFNVQALVLGDDKKVKEVKFEIEKDKNKESAKHKPKKPKKFKKIKTKDKDAPFAVFGDKDGDFKEGTLPAGDFVLEAEAKGKKKKGKKGKKGKKYKEFKKQTIAFSVEIIGEMIATRTMIAEEEEVDTETASEEVKTVVAQLLDGSEFLIYPNPAENFVNFAFANVDAQEQIALQIYNTSGQLIYAMETEGSLEETIDFSSYQPGTYIVKLVTPRFTEVRRFMLTK